MNVVFDTGIWVSGLLYEGPPIKAIERVVTGPHRLITSDSIQTELLRVLDRKFGWPSERATVTLRPYLVHAIHYQVRGTVRGICRDAADDMVLETAQISQADRLVTGDKDLLSLGTFGSTHIVTVRAFLDELSRA